MKKLQENIWDDMYYEEPDYSSEITSFENGGYEDFEIPDEYVSPDKAADVRAAAKERGMSDLDYVNQQEYFDELYETNPKLADKIEDIETHDFSEFVCDKDGNPNLEDAKPIFDNLVSGRERGLYGTDCKGDPSKALYDVIEGYDMMVSDAMIAPTLRKALQILAQFKDNPKCPHCKVYFDALANYAEQCNVIAAEVDPSQTIEIPGKVNESTKKTGKRFIKENQVSSNLTPAVDNFLHDVAQIGGTITYGDIMHFQPTPESLKELKKLRSKWREAAEYDDEDELTTIAASVAEVVKGSNITESQDVDCCDEDGCDCDAEWGDKRYVTGCCSPCGAEGTDTVEHFLIAHGFDDVEFACDLLDIDPLEEVCKECFESWIPELNAKYYSEYDDLGTDTRTGEPFPYRESKLNEAKNNGWSENDIANFAQSYVDEDEVTRENIVADLENDPYFADMFDKIYAEEDEGRREELTTEYSEKLDEIADAVIEELKGMGGNLVESNLNEDYDDYIYRETDDVKSSRQVRDVFKRELFHPSRDYPRQVKQSMAYTVQHNLHEKKAKRQ